MQPSVSALRDILADLVDEPLPTGVDLARDDVDGWDSLTHLQLVLALEEKFKVRLRTEHIADAATLGALARLIEGAQC